MSSARPQAIGNSGVLTAERATMVKAQLAATPGRWMQLARDYSFLERLLRTELSE